MNVLRGLCIQLGVLLWALEGSNGFPGGCLEPITAVCHIRPVTVGPDSSITGTLEFRQAGICHSGQMHPLVRVHGEINGVPPSTAGTGLHGFHVHTYGNLTNGCQSTGPHYNPFGTVHGRPADMQSRRGVKCRRHVGDLGNVFADTDGNINLDFYVPRPVSLMGEISIVGRAIVLHAGEDDLGRGGDTGSAASGNAGARIACCVIERVH